MTKDESDLRHFLTRMGFWQGTGVVPMGYECADHRLVISEAEAETVRKIFTQYVKQGFVSKLKKFLDRCELRGKTHPSTAGRMLARRRSFEAPSIKSSRTVSTSARFRTATGAIPGST